MPAIRLTYGINRFDGYWLGDEPDRIFVRVPPVQGGPVTWDDYVDVLHRFSRIERKPQEKDQTCHWTAPFLLGTEGEGRGMDNVVGMAAFASFDLDAEGWSLERLKRRLHGLACVLYTTTNSRPYPNLRWRNVIRLDRECTVEEYGAVWACINDLLDGALDHRTHNANRILYVPARWVGADNQFHVIDGSPLPIDLVLKAGYQPVAVETYAPIPAVSGATRSEKHTVITDNMISKFAAAAPHSGRFFKIMCQSAKWHRENGWELTDHELCDAALTVSAAYAPGIKRQNPMREAQRSLAWAQATVQPKSKLQRLREREAYILSMKGFDDARGYQTARRGPSRGTARD